MTGRSCLLTKPPLSPSLAVTNDFTFFWRRPFNNQMRFAWTQKNLGIKYFFQCLLFQYWLLTWFYSLFFKILEVTSSLNFLLNLVQGWSQDACWRGFFATILFSSLICRCLGSFTGLVCRWGGWSWDHWHVLHLNLDRSVVRCVIRTISKKAAVMTLERRPPH